MNSADFNDLRQEYVDTRWLGELRYEPKINDQFDLMVRFHANRYSFHGEYPYNVPPDTPNVEDYYGTWGGLEARIAYTPIKAIRITLGGEGQYHPQVQMFGNVGTAEITDQNNNVVFGSRAPYMDVNKPFGFGAGYLLFESSPVRWFRVSAGIRVDDYPASFGAIPIPRAALIFKPWQGGVIKLMFGRAFRAPSIYEEFYTDGGQTTLPGNDPKRGTVLKPESVYSRRDRDLPAVQGGLGRPRRRPRELRREPHHHHHGPAERARRQQRRRLRQRPVPGPRDRRRRRAAP